MIQGILLWIGTLLITVVHPFHVSICELEYQESSKSLEISSRMFIDDLEVALNKRYHVDNYFDSRDKALIDNDLKEFLQEKLVLELNGSLRQPNYLGHEIQDDVVWCYLELEKVKSLKKLTIEYSVLFDIFDDQFNLIHVKHQGKIKSLRFHKDKPSGSINY